MTSYVTLSSQALAARLHSVGPKLIALTLNKDEAVTVTAQKLLVSKGVCILWGSELKASDKFIQLQVGGQLAPVLRAVETELVGGVCDECHGWCQDNKELCDLQKEWSTAVLFDGEAKVRTIASGNHLEEAVVWSSVMLHIKDSCMIGGGTGLGKSTLVHWMLNRMLNDVKSVVLMDIDLGQPILGVPGAMHLWLITQPLFQFQTSATAEPILPAGITPVACAQSHPGRYLLKSVYMDGALSPSTNPGDYLLKIYHLHQVYKRFKAIWDETEQSLHKLPLLVNCCGWCHGTGWQLMDAVGAITGCELLVMISPQGGPETQTKTTPKPPVTSANKVPLGGKQTCDEETFEEEEACDLVSDATPCNQLLENYILPHNRHPFHSLLSDLGVCGYLPWFATDSNRAQVLTFPSVRNVNDFDENIARTNARRARVLSHFCPNGEDLFSRVSEGLPGDQDNVTDMLMSCLDKSRLQTFHLSLETLSFNSGATPLVIRPTHLSTYSKLRQTFVNRVVALESLPHECETVAEDSASSKEYSAPPSFICLAIVTEMDENGMIEFKIPPTPSVPLRYITSQVQQVTLTQFSVLDIVKHCQREAPVSCQVLLDELLTMVPTAQQVKLIQAPVQKQRLRPDLMSAAKHVEKDADIVKAKALFVKKRRSQVPHY
eukprot:Blabericola_migrator_1__11631@NODE_69_length_15356_cov_75_151481_g62_i0_p4_GENE_NODE_69_length_15356_cov_75_151481_g62_i0NODE_69_length_15356_cov_75_151481_g62_i0_p4_ORF_typecomplete_len661_score121_56CLP1_P/PF16575_5/8_5e22CLP1_P/PF16575_5/2_3e03IstB_IS21/PF01695_17/0_056DUF87/PF01935_17/0_07AAA_25/PF13481_6/0_11TrwB_AAD_bind/PF10412_9/0_12T2SSE/PF00437_20/0_16MeaB/PF03308_16/0_29VirC1/PF07015_11/0_35_NODE_69_length_15356_cov_75_151481_g62_i01254614528